MVEHDPEFEATETTFRERPGLDEVMEEALPQLDYPRLPEMVEAVGNVARRGNPVAALGGEGSGKELLYALAAADRCDPGVSSVQALVLSPTRETAVRAGRALHLLGGPVGLAALTWLPWRGGAAPGDHPFAQLLSGRPGELLPQVQAGRLALSDLELVAVDGVTALERTGQWDAVASILDTLPAEVQKIVTDVRRSETLDSLLTHQMSRARKWPPEPFAPGAGREGEPSGSPVWCASASDPEVRVDRLAAGLRAVEEETGAGSAAVLCPDGATAHRVASSLAARGLALTEHPDEPGVMVLWGEEPPPEDAVRVLFGLPMSLEEMKGWLGGGPARIVIVESGREAQLRLLARRAGWPVRALPEPPEPDARDRVQRYRERVRDRISSRDNAAESLVLEPLLREFGAGQVAAALSALLRERTPGARTEAGGEAEAAAGSREPRTERAPARQRQARRKAGRPSGEPGSGWVRLFISAGERDDVGPGDLVGAITGETSAVGGQIGRIDVRSSYSLVDVDPGVADEVMEKLTGVNIKGREVIARPDREG